MMRYSISVELDLRAGVLAEEDLVAGLHVEGDLRPLVVDAPGADGDDLAICGFSLAVSGMMIPPLVFSSSSSLLTRILSCNGLIFMLPTVPPGLKGVIV